MIDTIVTQITSGRWLLTVATGVILIHFAWVLPPDKIDKIIDICKDIVIFYFVVKNTTTTTGGTNASVKINPIVTSSVDSTEPIKS